MNRREHLRWLPHNLIGHGIGYCLVAPFWPTLGQMIHDFTLPRGER